MHILATDVQLFGNGIFFAWVCGRSLHGIVRSNPAVGMTFFSLEGDFPITRPEGSCRVSGGLTVCDLETSKFSRPRPTGGCRAMKKNIYICVYEVYILTSI
jgi:hypothetical protein